MIAAVLDGRNDGNVFRWAGPETGLNDPCRPPERPPSGESPAFPGSAESEREPGEPGPASR